MQDTDSFYRAKISSFENERRIFQEYIALITPSKGELHVLDWEYRQGIANAEAAVADRERVEMELKRVRKETSIARDQILALTKTSDARRLQIETLSELSQPVQKDTTYLVNDRFVHSTSTTSTNAANLRPNQNLAKGSSAGTIPSAGPVKVKEREPASKLYGKSVRTGDIVQLENKVEEETRRVMALVHDLTTSLKEVNEGSARLDIAVTQALEVRRNEAAELVKEVDRLDYQGYLSVAELLKLRLKIMKAQREEVEELERLHDDKVFFAAKEAAMREQLVTDMNLMKRRLRAEAAAANKDFQSQHEQLDETLKKLKRKEWTLSQDQKKSSSKYENREQLMVQAKDRYERLRRRNALEMEGYNNEAKFLKAKLQKLQDLYDQKQARAQLQQARAQRGPSQAQRLLFAHSSSS